MEGLLNFSAWLLRFCGLESLSDGFMRWVVAAGLILVAMAVLRFLLARRTPAYVSTNYLHFESFHSSSRGDNANVSVTGFVGGEEYEHRLLFFSWTSTGVKETSRFRLNGGRIALDEEIDTGEYNATTMMPFASACNIHVRYYRPFHLLVLIGILIVLAVCAFIAISWVILAKWGWTWWLLLAPAASGGLGAGAVEVYKRYECGKSLSIGARARDGSVLGIAVQPHEYGSELHMDEVINGSRTIRNLLNEQESLSPAPLSMPSPAPLSMPSPTPGAASSASRVKDSGGRGSKKSRRSASRR